MRGAIAKSGPAALLARSLARSAAHRLKTSPPPSWLLRPPPPPILELHSAFATMDFVREM